MLCSYDAGLVDFMSRVKTSRGREARQASLNLKPLTALMMKSFTTFDSQSEC